MCDCQLAFGFLMVGIKKMLSKGHSMFLCKIFKFHLGCREVWKCHFLFFENSSFCNSCVGKVAECFWGHIVTLCRARHLIQCKFAHFILPRLWPFLPTLSSPAPPILWPPVTSSEAQETNKFAKILPEQVFQSLY